MIHLSGLPRHFQRFDRPTYCARYFDLRSTRAPFIWLILIGALFCIRNETAQAQELNRAAAPKPAQVKPLRADHGALAASATAVLTEMFAPGYILVQPRAGLSDAAFANVLKPHGGKAVGELGNLGIYVVTLPPNASERAVANVLAHDPHIKFAEPDALVLPDLIPNDTYYGSEWHLQKLNASAAWDYSRGSGVTVAVLDSGIDATHPDLGGNVVPGWNFWDNNSNTADVYGHGTEVAGVVAAIGNNGIGVTGIAWNAKLMPIRVTNTSGWASLSAIASGLNYAADHGAKVANLSFAVQSYSTVITAAQYFKNKGGVVVNSAGNGGALDSSAPSDALVSVSATDSTDTLAGWSSYGPYVDLSAPGVGIWTTKMGGSYGAVSGTSFSSPLTAGVAALILGANSKLAPSQVVSILESTAFDRGTTGNDQYYGYGRVNAGAAVLTAAQTASADTEPPGVAISSPSDGATVSGIVPVDVVATDNVGVARVDLLINGTVSATDSTAPYAFSWDATGLVGSVATISARAYDAAGNSAIAPSVNVAVASSIGADTIPPIVAIASPTSGTVSGIVSVSVSANDNVGVTRVDLLLNGVVFASSTKSPFGFNWDTSSLAGTSATLMARAYDAAGNAANSQTVAVAVSSGAPPAQPDTIPPTISISNPSNGSRVNGMVSIAATAKDNVGVANVSLLLDGVMVITGNSSSLSYRWNSKKAASGTHTISAIAKDLSGNQATTTIQVIK